MTKMLIYYPFTAITAEMIENVIATKYEEGTDIDYKETYIPNPSEPERKKRQIEDLRKDVISFANARGGVIIYGVKDENGVPVEVPGINSENDETYIQSLLSICRSHHIKPHVIGIQAKIFSINVEGTIKKIALLYIPQSFQAPHQYFSEIKNEFLFWIREHQNRPMQIEDIREAVLMGATWQEQIKDFVENRIRLSNSGTTPVPLRSKPTLLLHCAPVNAFFSSQNIDLSQHYASNEIEYLQRSTKDFPELHFNLSGLLLYCPFGDEEQNTNLRYLQIFRNGIIEIADAHHIGLVGSITDDAFAKAVAERLSKLFSFYRRLNILSPVFLSVSLRRVRGLELSRLIPSHTGYNSRPSPGLDSITPEGVIIQSIDDDPLNAIAPIMHQLCNAFGYPRCECYDENNHWTRG